MNKLKQLIEAVQEILDENKGKKSGRSGSQHGWNKPSGGKKHNPFKYRDRLDDGPMQQVKKKKDEWRCKCNDYKCVCHGKGGKVKNMRQNPDRKASYQRLWLDKLQGRRAAGSVRKQKSAKAK